MSYDEETPRELPPPRKSRRPEIYVSGFTIQRILMILFLVAALIAAGIGDSWMAAHAATTTAARPPGGQIITIPYCQKHPPSDLCLEAMGLHVAAGATKGGDLDVISAIQLKTEHTPGKSTVIKVQLWFKGLDGWTAAEYRFYRIHDLPLPGHKGWLHPGVRSECAPTKWELVMTITGHTSKGNARLETFYWPGSRIKKDKVIASDGAAGVNSKYWPGFKARCLHKRRAQLLAAQLPAITGPGRIAGRAGQLLTVRYACAQPSPQWGVGTGGGGSSIAGIVPEGAGVYSVKLRPEREWIWISDVPTAAGNGCASIRIRVVGRAHRRAA